MHSKYQFWKNLGLILIALLGFFYALPNLYSEEPVIQISSLATNNSASISQKVATLLSTEKIPYRAIDEGNETVVVRFSSPDYQLAAQDALKNGLGKGYTVALNLMPATPSWLARLHAEPMKQGLDLRGGVHFLLEVDVDAVIARRYEGLSKSIGQDLRSRSIRYMGLRYVRNEGLDIRFRSLADYNAGLELIKENYDILSLNPQPSDYLIKISLMPVELNAIRQRTIDQTMSILRNRVNELGVGEAVVQQQGATRVAVDLPGIQDATRAKDILGGTATLQFHLVDAEHDPLMVKQTGVIPVDAKLYEMNGYPILLKRQVVLSGDSITSAVSSFDQQTATPAVQIQLGGGGEHFFTATTRDNIGKRMAIVFVETKTSVKTINGESKRLTQHEEKIISAPVIQSALGNNFQITGLTDSKEASNLALLLRAGALPTVIYPVEERTVGPSLGKENIRRGMVSLEVGMGLILVVMLVYYRFFGLVANIALFLNLILLSAVLSLIGTTLTLPGIAAFVLTVGMAVDANVLIYERIREELRNGVSPHTAIHAGYDRAFATIMDANITTFIVGVVLFAIGTGPIKGFAVILSLGLLTSMLTSVTYTRAIVNAYYGQRTIKKLSIGI